MSENSRISHEDAPQSTILSRAYHRMVAEQERADACPRCYGKKTVKRSIPVIVNDGEKGCEAFEKPVSIACPYCVPHPVAK